MKNQQLTVYGVNNGWYSLGGANILQRITLTQRLRKGDVMYEVEPTEPMKTINFGATGVEEILQNVAFIIHS